MYIITVIISSSEIGWGAVCLHCYFQVLLLVADASHLCGLNLSDKGGASLPPGHRLFMYQIYFCCHGLTGFTSHLLGWSGGRGGVRGGSGVRTLHCGIWVQCGGVLLLFLWNIPTIFHQYASILLLKNRHMLLTINVWSTPRSPDL